MFGQPVMEREWSLHAQLTISHGGGGSSVTASSKPLQATVEMADTARPSASVSNLPGGGVHLEYSWKNGSKSSSNQNPSVRQELPHHTGNVVFSLKRHSGEPRSHSFHFVPMSSGVQHSQREVYSENVYSRDIPGIRVDPPNAREVPPSRAQHQDSGYFSSPVYNTLPRCTPSHSACPSHTCTFVLSPNIPNYSTNQNASSTKVVDARGFPLQGQLLLYPGQTLRLDMPRSHSLKSTLGPPPVVNRNTWSTPMADDVKPKRPTSLNVPTSAMSPHQEIKENFGQESMPDTACTVCAPTSSGRENHAECQGQAMKNATVNRDASCQTSRSGVKKQSHHSSSGSKSYSSRRKTDSDLPSTSSSFHLHPPSSHHYEMGEELKRNKLRRSPARVRGTSPFQGMKPKASTSFSLKTNGKKRQKPRTVHIDVYCTASEDDADASQSASSQDDHKHSSDEDSTSSPQTVYESEEFRVVHSKAKKNQLPAAFFQSNKVEESKDKSPSKKSPDAGAEKKQANVEYSNPDSSCKSFESTSFKDCDQGKSRGNGSVGACGGCGGPTRDPSWSTLSASSGRPYHDEEDSDSTATSWKDTITDVGENDAERSFSSLVQSDSFEYADNGDLHRIREKEMEWSRTGQSTSSGGRNIGPRTWRSPQVERLQYLQQLRFKHLVAKHMRKPTPGPLSDKCSEDSLESSDVGEESDVSGLKGCVLKEALYRNPPDLHENPIHRTSSPSNQQSRPAVSPPVQLRRALSPRWVAPHGGPFVPQVDSLKSPDSVSPPIIPSKSSVMSPFTNRHGTSSDPMVKAQRFGTIVGKFRKPGHHVGPSKNAECSCEHCRRYFENNAISTDDRYRGRTKSVGDMPFERKRADHWPSSLQTSLCAEVESRLNLRSHDSSSNVPSLSDSEVEKSLPTNGGLQLKSQNEKARKPNTSNGSHVGKLVGEV